MYQIEAVYYGPCSLISPPKGKRKHSSLINFAIYRNSSAQVCYVIVHKVKANSLAVFVLVEGLIQAKHIIMLFFTVKSDSVI